MKLGRQVNLSGLFSTTGLLHLSDTVWLSCGLAAPMFSPFSCSRNKNNYVHCTPVHWSINRLCSNNFLALSIERSTYSTSNNLTMLKPGSVCYQIKHILQVWIWAACTSSFLHCFLCRCRFFLIGAWLQPIFFYICSCFWIFITLPLKECEKRRKRNRVCRLESRGSWNQKEGGLEERWERGLYTEWMKGGG
jgi:hypothetical protein